MGHVKSGAARCLRVVVGPHMAIGERGWCGGKVGVEAHRHASAGKLSHSTVQPTRLELLEVVLVPLPHDGRCRGRLKV